MWGVWRVCRSLRARKPGQYVHARRGQRWRGKPDFRNADPQPSGQHIHGMLQHNCPAGAGTGNQVDGHGPHIFNMSSVLGRLLPVGHPQTLVDLDKFIRGLGRYDIHGFHTFSVTPSRPGLNQHGWTRFLPATHAHENQPVLSQDQRVFSR